MKFYIVLVATVILAAILVSSAADSSILTSSEQIQPKPAATAAHADDDSKRITLEDAKTAFDAGEAVFVDARSAEAYKNEHIKGALSIPLAEVENRYKELPKNKTIIFYCS